MGSIANFILSDNPFPTSRELLRIRAQTLLERSTAVEAGGDSLLKHFTHPSWQELQLEDSRDATTIACAIADVRDLKNLETLPVRVQEGYRNAAALALHWLDQAWRREAFSQAIAQVCSEIDELDHDDRARACRGLDTPEIEWLAARVLELYGRVLQGQGIAPATYLRLRAMSALEGRR